MTAPDRDPQLSVSVVVASHRPAFLRDLLTAFSSQSMEPSRFEIIAVCDYPTATLATDFPNVIIRLVNDLSISRKRNLGVALVQAPIVAFIDDDCLPAPDWLENGYRYLAAHPEAAAVEGHTAIQTGQDAIPALREYRRLEKPGYRTNNLFCRARAFHNAGGFDERFTVQREDLDLCFTFLDKGLAIHRVPDCAVTHRIRHNEPWDLLKNCVNRRFDPLLFKKHPARYRQHVASPVPPSLLLLLILHLLVLLSPLVGLRVFFTLCAIDLAAVSVIALRRCAWRAPPLIFITEWLSCLVAPAVLATALLYGSIRFRRFLFL